MTVLWLATAAGAETALSPELPGTGATEPGGANGVCPAGATLCDGACVELESSSTHCGSCGAPCAAGTVCEGGQRVGEGAFVSVCGWHGFAWTGAGPEGVSTISPAGFTDLAAGSPICAKGTVGAAQDYGGHAIKRRARGCPRLGPRSGAGAGTALQDS